MSSIGIPGQAKRPVVYSAPRASIPHANPIDGLDRQAPPGAQSLGLIQPTPELLEPAAPEAPERQESGWRKVATLSALALSAVGAGAGLLGASSPAMAQSISVPAARNTDPVRITSAQDLVNRFTAERQLYIQGRPVSADQEHRLEQMLARHPNIYVVVVDNAGQLEGYHGTANHGIGESGAFHSVVDETTGQKDGVVFFVYMDSSQGKKIYMRAEGLPDQLGVGEENFAGPRSNTLVDIFKANVGQGDLASGIGAVANRINTTVHNYVVGLADGANSAVRRAESAVAEGRQQVQEFREKNGSTSVPVDVGSWEQDLARARNALERRDYQTAKNLAEGVLSGVTGAQTAMANFERIRSQALSTVASARTALEGMRESVNSFRVEHGDGGLASPNLSGWSATLDQAEKNAAAGQFQVARDTAQEVLDAIRTQQELMARFEQAPAASERIAGQLAQAEAKLAGLPESEQTPLRGVLEQARSSYADFQAKLQSKDAGFYTSQQHAAHDADTAVEVIEGAENRVHQAETMRKLAIGGVAAGIAVLGLVANYRASSRRKEARLALEDANTEIAAKTKALMDLLDEVDVHKLSNYSGEMGDLVASLSENVGAALTLMGGAEKVLAEASERVDSKSALNWVSPHNYNKALALLTKEDERVRFSLSDPSRAVMEGSDQARSWKEELLKRGASREYEKSLYEILLAMAEKRDNAQELLDRLALLEALERAKASGNGDRFQACFDSIASVRASLENTAADINTAKGSQLVDVGNSVTTTMASSEIQPAETALGQGQQALAAAENSLRQNQVDQGEEHVQEARAKNNEAKAGIRSANDALKERHDNVVAAVEEQARQRAEEARRYRDSYSSGGWDRDDNYSSGSSSSSSSSWNWGSSDSGSSSSGSSSSSWNWGGGSSSSDNDDSSSSSWGSSGSSWGSGSSDSGSSGSSWGSGSGSSGGSSGGSWSGGSSGSSW
ncbi:MAG: hypothetical protein AB7S38_28350 [Vulcanimicrobiota bacterium]